MSVDKIMEVLIFFLWFLTMTGFVQDDVYSFTSSFMNDAIFRGASEMSTWAYDRNVDIFSKKMLLIPDSFHKHRSLFVVINVSTQFNNSDVNSLSEDHLVLIHFDSP